MKTQSPAPEMSLPISLELHQKLISASLLTGFQQETWEIAAVAIRDWMSRNSPDSLPMPVAAGYQWKHLFLPSGTLLRTVFNGKNYHCLVEGDQIRYEGQSISPSGFVNAVGGVRRSAWKAVWILFPNSSAWKLAESLRLKNNPRRQRT